MLMQLRSRQNLCFTSKFLWTALVISFSSTIAAGKSTIDLHSHWLGTLCVLSGLISLVLIICSWIRGERQVLFLFIVFVLAIYTVILPLIDTVPQHRKVMQSLQP